MHQRHPYILASSTGSTSLPQTRAFRTDDCRTRFLRQYRRCGMETRYALVSNMHFRRRLRQTWHLSMFRDGNPLVIQLFRRQRMTGRLKPISAWSLLFSYAYRASSRSPEENIGMPRYALWWLRVADYFLRLHPQSGSKSHYHPSSLCT
jgi:hypothetical protein